MIKGSVPVEIKGRSSKAGGKESSRKLLSSPPRSWSRLALLLGLTAIVASAATLASVLLLPGRVFHREGEEFRRYATRFLQRPVVYPAWNYIEGKLANLDRISIDIDHRKSQKLAYWRREALRRGTLHGVDHDWVGARVRYRGEVTPVRIRLKGGNAGEHLGGTKWSLRLRVSGDRALFGMKEFSLMDPQRRRYLKEWLLRVAAAEEDIISKRYRFVGVAINGDDKGVYALDEHLNATLLEFNRRREGPILRLAQEPSWSAEAAWHLADLRRDDYFSADVDAIGSGETDVGGDRTALHRAMTLFEAFRAGDLRPAEAFDVPRLARWMALGDVLGARPGSDVFEMRFYYNPLTSTLEPIAGDTFGESVKATGYERFYRLNDQSQKSAFHGQVFSDLEFTAAYLKELDRFTRSAYFDDLLGKIRDALKNNLAILHRDYPLYEFPIDQLYATQAELRRASLPARGIAAYLERNDGKDLALKVAVIQTVPVEILALHHGEVSLAVSRGDTVLPGNEYSTPLEHHEVGFELQGDPGRPVSVSELGVRYRILGTTTELVEPVVDRPAYRRSSAVAEMGRTTRPEDTAFLEMDAERREIVVRSGEWVIEESVTIPPGLTLVVKAGTVLDLRDGASIRSYSPVSFAGRESAPIRVRSSDSTGRGLVILNAQRTSVFRHTRFENLAEPSEDGWRLTGAVTIY